MVFQPNRVLEEEARVDIYQDSPLDNLIHALQGPSDQVREERRQLASQDDLYAILAVRNWRLDTGAALLERRQLITVEDAHRAELVLQVPSFIAFAGSYKSANFFVHGTPEALQATGLFPISGLSLFAKALHDTLREAVNARYRPLVFFCGNHTFASDPSTGAAGLFRCLILQLLRKFTFDMAGIPNYVDIAKLETGDLESLRRVFIMLAQQLPGSETLFIVIDGICYYENTAYEHDLRIAIDCLLGMADDYNISACVKLLLTSVLPYPGIASHPLFEEGDVLSLGDVEEIVDNIAAADKEDDDDGKRSFPPFGPAWKVRVAETFGM